VFYVTLQAGGVREIVRCLRFIVGTRDDPCPGLRAAWFPLIEWILPLEIDAPGRKVDKNEIRNRGDARRRDLDEEVA
jgi:hypothetical protein